MKFIIQRRTWVFVSNSLKKATFFKKQTTVDLEFFREDIIVDPIGTYMTDKSIAAFSLKNEQLYVFALNNEQQRWKNYSMIIVNNKDVKVLSG